MPYNWRWEEDSQHAWLIVTADFGSLKPSGSLDLSRSTSFPHDLQAKNCLQPAANKRHCSLLSIRDTCPFPRISKKRPSLASHRLKVSIGFAPASAPLSTSVKIRKKRSLPLEVKLAGAAPLARWAEPRHRPVVPCLQSSSSSPKSGVPAGRLPAAWSGEARSPLPFLACPAMARTGRPCAALEVEELAQRHRSRRLQSRYEGRLVAGLFVAAEVAAQVAAVRVDCDGGRRAALA
jgi:hypothetical protein